MNEGIGKYVHFRMPEGQGADMRPLAEHIGPLIWNNPPDKLIENVNFCTGTICILTFYWGSDLDTKKVRDAIAYIKSVYPTIILEFNKECFDFS